MRASVFELLICWRPSSPLRILSSLPRQQLLHTPPATPRPQYTVSEGVASYPFIRLLICTALLLVKLSLDLNANMTNVFATVFPSS